MRYFRTVKRLMKQKRFEQEFQVRMDTLVKDARVDYRENFPKILDNLK